MTVTSTRTADKSVLQPSMSPRFDAEGRIDLADKHTHRPHVKPQQIVQRINSLELQIWMAFPPEELLTHEEALMKLWLGLMTAHISKLSLGEWASLLFCRHLHSLESSHPHAYRFAHVNLQLLTLNLNICILSDLSSPEDHSCLPVLTHLTRLTSLTLHASEVHPGGGRLMQAPSVYAVFNKLPANLTSLALHNFRNRWQMLSTDLSSKPSLVKLDLTRSCCLFPEDSDPWTQLHQLKLRSSVVWLRNAQPFQFSRLTQLTQLDLGGCQFANFSPGQIGNTHHYVYHQLQAPTSIVSLNLATKSVQVGLASIAALHGDFGFTTTCLRVTCTRKD